VAQYLSVVLAEGDAGELADALGHIAKGKFPPVLTAFIDIVRRGLSINGAVLSRALPMETRLY
jgi:hypothetical protein